MLNLIIKNFLSNCLIASIKVLYIIVRILFDACSNKDPITPELLSAARVFVIAGSREKFTVDEVRLCFRNGYNFNLLARIL